MSQPSPTELSLRHLPDLSESSFQIPLADSSFLLSDDDDDADADFFQGADDSLGTPVPPRIIHEPLTLSQLTPKPAATTTADDALPAPFLAATSPPKTPVPDADGKPITDDRGTDGRSRVRSTLKLAIAPVGRPSGRFDVLKKEVETLISDSENVRPVSTLPLRGRSRPRGKPTVAAGGISKHPKGKNLPKSEFTRSIITQASKKLPFSRPAEALATSPEAEIDVLSSSHSPYPDQSYANTSVGSIAGDGVAGRLLMYSQKFMPSFGLFDPGQPSISETTSPSRDPQVSSEADAPLTLSQVSPSKLYPAEISNMAQNRTTTSPMRPPTKRPVSRTAAASSHQLKKEKVMAAPVTAVQASIQNKASAAARRKNDVVGKSRARPLRRTEEVPGEGKGKERAICNCATSGSHGPECRWKDDDDDDDDMEGIPKHQTQPVTAGRIPHSKGPGTTLHGTKPIGFNFRLESRMGTRKNESGGKTVSRKTAQSALPVPDFKALHAAQETRDALRKEQIARVYPLRIELNTDSRAKEREKFDEMIRERERENERALEERKREKEAEEEREIREMRKKAVPKAHEVPGWYREAPRKKDMASASAKSLFLTG